MWLFNIFKNSQKCMLWIKQENILKGVIKMKKTIFVLAFLFIIPVVSVKAETIHTVVKGDTLWELSRDYKVDLLDIRKTNDKWDDLILIGQDITIPTEGTVSTPVKKTATPSTTVKQESKAVSSNNSSVSSNEKDLLARLVRAEAEGEPYRGKVEVAKVVLNRVESGQFPNTIKGVIYQRGQFSPVSNGAINRSADSESLRAVEEAISIGGQANGALFFYNPRTATNSWSFGRPVVTTIGNHQFTR
jgi:N-acetylmuramoyl-L-alanine amidase